MRPHTGNALRAANEQWPSASADGEECVAPSAGCQPMAGHDNATVPASAGSGGQLAVVGHCFLKAIAVLFGVEPAEEVLKAIGN